VFLEGFIPTENLRFRDFELNFRTKDGDAEDREEKKKKKEEKDLTPEE